MKLAFPRITQRELRVHTGQEAAPRIDLGSSCTSSRSASTSRIGNASNAGQLTVPIGAALQCDGVVDEDHVSPSCWLSKLLADVVHCCQKVSTGLGSNMLKYLIFLRFLTAGAVAAGMQGRPLERCVSRSLQSLLGTSGSPWLPQAGTSQRLLSMLEH